MKLNELITAHVVYRLKLPDVSPDTIFIGCCPLAELALMSDAPTYKMFVDRVSQTDRADVSVVSIHANQAEAQMVQSATAMIERAIINRDSDRCEAPTIRYSRGQPVKNLQSGVTYPSANQAAKAIGVTSSAMSQHLAGAIPRLKGCVFERVGA